MKDGSGREPYGCGPMEIREWWAKAILGGVIWFIYSFFISTFLFYSFLTFIIPSVIGVIFVFVCLFVCLVSLFCGYAWYGIGMGSGKEGSGMERNRNKLMGRKGILGSCGIRSPSSLKYWWCLVWKITRNRVDFFDCRNWKIVWQHLNLMLPPQLWTWWCGIDRNRILIDHPKIPAMIGGGGRTTYFSLWKSPPWWCRVNTLIFPSYHHHCWCRAFFHITSHHHHHDDVVINVFHFLSLLERPTFFLSISLWLFLLKIMFV